jgi:hypothetical protein
LIEKLEASELNALTSTPRVALAADFSAKWLA